MQLNAPGRGETSLGLRRPLRRELVAAGGGERREDAVAGELGTGLRRLLDVHDDDRILARAAPLDDFVRAAPLDDFVRAASLDPDPARVRAHNERLRRQGYAQMVEHLGGRFGLRPGLEPQPATDILVLVGPATYQTLVWAAAVARGRMLRR